ncbi:hypothetical protein OAO87_04750 [bacterium]|nr:hypothetical protein [bacterium]
MDILFPTGETGYLAWARMTYTGVCALGAAAVGWMGLTNFWKAAADLASMTAASTGSGEPSFSWKMYFLLCFSESATPIACGTMLAHAGWLSPLGATALAATINLCGYFKYYLQMWYSNDYVATSIWTYVLAYLGLAVLQRNPLYFVLFFYPFPAIFGKVPTYGDMRGRAILHDDASIVLHSVDHLCHSMVTCRVLLYHFFGLLPIVCLDPLLMPFIYYMSDEMVKIQQGISYSKAAEKSMKKANTAQIP